MRRSCPGLDVFGLGGPMMQKAGLRSLADHEQLAVMGFSEIIPKFLFFRRLLKHCYDEIEKLQPRAVILIDYPGFNLRLAAKIKHLGIPIIYYISPQVWAWGKGRIAEIKKLVDLMLVIFPFEETFYREHGVAARFTGHPIVDRYGEIPDKQACRESIGIGENEKLIALLPGSRLQEVRRMLPTMVEAVDLIRKKIENSVFIVAGVKNLDPRLYSDIIGDKKITLLTGKAPEIMNGADLVITSSGTATIETAYFMTPMVVIYKTGFFTYHIARHLINLDMIGMVNIVAGRRAVPELIQGQATAKSIASHTVKIMADRDLCRRMVDDLKAVREKLGAGDSGKLAAEAIREVVRPC